MSFDLDMRTTWLASVIAICDTLRERDAHHEADVLGRWATALELTANLDGIAVRPATRRGRGRPKPQVMLSEAGLLDDAGHDALGRVLVRLVSPVAEASAWSTT